MIDYLLFTLLAVIVQGIFAFFEMACVSFNKVRLQYYVSIGTRRAIWINYLLKKPSRLFGTTLLGITTSLVIGSECARQVYESMHVDPDWAPLTQVPLVIIFGELVPMFAARRYPEQSAMLLAPFMILIAKILMPITWTFDAISRLLHRSMGKETSLFLSREEVRMAFEEKEGAQDELNLTIGQIFQLKTLTAAQLMLPISKVQMVPTHATLAEVRHNLSVHYAPMIPIYHRSFHNIVAIVRLKDLLKLEDHKKVMEVSHSPWFVTQDTSILQLLQQFRRNKQSVAVILDASGQACGVLTLDQILSQIFGDEPDRLKQATSQSHFIDRTLSGDMPVAEFNRLFKMQLIANEGDTLGDFLLEQLGHPPVKGESLQIQDLEFTVETPTLRGIKTLSVRSILD